MAGRRFSSLISLLNSSKSSLRSHSFQSYNANSKLFDYKDRAHARLSYAFVDHNYQTSQGQKFQNNASYHFQMSAFQSLSDCHCQKTKPVSAFSHKSSNSLFRSPFSNSRSYSFSSTNKDEKSGDVGIVSGSTDGGVDVSNNADLGSDWIEKAKVAWQSAVDAASFTGEKAKEVSDQMFPHVEQLLNTHPYLKNVIVPMGSTVIATMLAWLVMPKILRRIHRYAMQGSASLLPGSVYVEQVPYEKSFWGAFEDPLRYLVTFIAFTEIGRMVAPTTVASQYITQVWRGAVVVSFVWFLYRWKTNVFTHALARHSLSRLDRERFLTLDRVSSVGLFAIGFMALAEACGVAVHSLLTVGGIGGVATAFAARDILGNVLSGLAMQFSKPFSLGDTIKAGSVEGQVVEMGLTTTSLLNAEKFPVIVPNSLFSSQVIVNKSRAEWRAMTTKIPLQIEDVSRFTQITEDIKSMLRSHPKVFLGKEVPYCFLSRIESSHAELTLGCNLKQMSKDELYSTEQDILLQSVDIIKKHGAALGST